MQDACMKEKDVCKYKVFMCVIKCIQYKGILEISKYL